MLDTCGFRAKLLIFAGDSADNRYGVLCKSRRKCYNLSMQLVDPHDNLDFATIPIDSFWNIGDDAEPKMHRIHAYPAKFPAFLASKSIDYAQSENIPCRVVGDIFCGCGTVAYESLRKGVNFWGCDINPVAVLIASVKSQSCYQAGWLEQYYSQILQSYKRIKSARCPVSPVALERIIHWFEPEQISDLARLLKAIRRTLPENSKYRAFFLCAFSNILKATSRWLTRSIKPQIDPHKIGSSVLDAFHNQCQLMFQANESNDLPKNCTAEILKGNFLSMTPPRKLNLIITSPPYVTSYEYADLHQLSALWLGFANDYRELRQGSIGSFYNDFNFPNEVAKLNRTGSNVVFSLYNEDRYQARAIAKYYLDMQEMTQKVSKILASRGMAVFVIGDTEYKGIRIENAKHLVESLNSSGFRKVLVTKRKISNKILTPYRDSIGRFTTNSESRKVYSEEFIVVAKRS
jgi:methylase of polypeptide subunit release factors